MKFLDMAEFGTHGCPCVAILHDDGNVEFQDHCPTCMSNGQTTPLWAGAAIAALRRGDGDEM